MAARYAFDPASAAAAQRAVDAYLRDASTLVGAVDWHDPAVCGLVAFHVVVFTAVALLRNSVAGCAVLLFLLSTLAVAAPQVNAALRSAFQGSHSHAYFDPRGVFITIFWSIPLIIALAGVVAALVRLTLRRMALLHQVRNKAAARSSKASRSTVSHAPSPASTPTSRRKATRNTAPSPSKTPTRNNNKTSVSSTPSKTPKRREAAAAVASTPVPDTPRSRAARSRSFQAAMHRRAERDE